MYFKILRKLAFPLIGVAATMSVTLGSEIQTDGFLDKKLTEQNMSFVGGVCVPYVMPYIDTGKILPYHIFNTTISKNEVHFGVLSSELQSMFNISSPNISVSAQYVSVNDNSAVALENQLKLHDYIGFDVRIGRETISTPGWSVNANVTLEAIIFGEDKKISSIKSSGPVVIHLTDPKVPNSMIAISPSNFGLGFSCADLDKNGQKAILFKTKFSNCSGCAQALSSEGKEFLALHIICGKAQQDVDTKGSPYDVSTAIEKKLRAEEMFLDLSKKWEETQKFEDDEVYFYWNAKNSLEGDLKEVECTARPILNSFAVIKNNPVLSGFLGL